MNDTPDTEKNTVLIVDEVLGDLNLALQVITESAPASVWRTFEDGIAQKPEANLAVISTPGEYVAREAHKAIEAGLNVFIFSTLFTLELCFCSIVWPIITVYTHTSTLITNSF